MIDGENEENGPSVPEEVVEAEVVSDNGMDEALSKIAAITGVNLDELKDAVDSVKGNDEDYDLSARNGVYFSPEEDIEAGNADVFLSKIFVNILLNYKPTHSYDTVLREMVTRLADNHFHRPWIKQYVLDIDAYKKAHPENKFALPREAFTPDEIVEFGKTAQARLHADEFPITKSAQLLADILELSKVETLFMQLALKMSSGMSYDFHSLFEQFRYSELGEQPAKFFGELFGINEEDVAVAMKGFLFQSGLLTYQDARHKPFYYINAEMRDAFCSQHLSVESLTEQLFPSNISTDLTIADYPHLKTNIERSEKIIAKALTENTKGINMMFWGIPGTGKTELALMMAKRNGWNLRIIGDISEADNKEKSRAERLVSLKIALKFYGRDTNTVLLFDEMEDIFKTDNNAAFSKAFINRIVETTTVPIIWTTNDLMVIGDAMLRRMVYNIAFEVPPVEARRTMWQRYTDKYKLGLEDRVLDDLAETYDTAPALIHNAAKITSMAGLESGELPDIVQSLDRLVHYGKRRKFEPRIVQDDTYDISCVNTDTDLVALTDRLMECKPQFSVLLYGAPGTGKSEYGRHIAKRMGKKFMFKRASDLMSKWVGETEQNIAEAFLKAKEEKAFLLIDEGDSFLRNREGAERSWEVTQVNEMLSQMERHTEPFVLTTNLMKHLDPAAMRRFTFKMKFEFLRPDQSVKLFERYFKCEAPRSIERMETLAPGDFANVRRRADIMGVTDARKLLDMLVEECDVKPQKSKKMGF